MKPEDEIQVKVLLVSQSFTLSYVKYYGAVLSCCVQQS